MKYNLSEINEVIRNRRTIYPKHYSDRKVHREQIELLLDNARWAPTHKMTQPWYFKVFMGDGLQKFADFQSEAYKKITPEDKFLERKYEKLKNNPLKASAIIAICLRRDEDERVPELEEVCSVACAVQNMHLTATAFGLAAYWSTGGMTYQPDIIKPFLGLGEDDHCMGFFYVGYPAEEWPKGQRRPIEYYTDWVE